MLRYNLKIFLGFIYIFNFLNIFSMERVNQEVYEINLAEFFESQEIKENLNIPELPQEIWFVIVGFVKNLNFNSEEEVFKTFNSLRRANKFLKSLVDKLKEQSSVIKNLTYKQFQLNLVDGIMFSGVDHYDPLIFVNRAKNFKAYKWSKYKKNIFGDYVTSLNDQLLLHLNKNYDVKEYLQLGADPNAKSGSIHILHFIVNNLYKYANAIDEGSNQKILMNARLLLSHGSDPMFKDLSNKSPLESARALKIKNEEGWKIEKKSYENYLTPYEIWKKTRLYKQINNLERIIKLFEKYIPDSNNSQK